MLRQWWWEGEEKSALFPSSPIFPSSLMWNINFWSPKYILSPCKMFFFPMSFNTKLTNSAMKIPFLSSRLYSVLLCLMSVWNFPSIISVLNWISLPWTFPSPVISGPTLTVHSCHSPVAHLRCLILWLAWLSHVQSFPWSYLKWQLFIFICAKAVFLSSH